MKKILFPAIVSLVLFFGTRTNAQGHVVNAQIELSKATYFLFEIKLPMLIDYGNTLEDVRRESTYDRIGLTNANINSNNFPNEKTGVVSTNAILVHYMYPVSADMVLSDFKDANIRPATMLELMEFGPQYTDMLSQMIVVGLGTNSSVYGGFPWIGTEAYGDLEADFSKGEPADKNIYHGIDFMFSSAHWFLAFPITNQ